VKKGGGLYSGVKKGGGLYSGVKKGGEKGFASLFYEKSNP
jgi:hypothetical protein